MSSGAGGLGPEVNVADASAGSSDARVADRQEPAETAVPDAREAPDVERADAAEPATEHAEPAGEHIEPAVEHAEPTAEAVHPRTPNRRRMARRIAVGLAIACAVLVLLPVLAAPITADDRYWYLWTTAISDGSLPRLLGWSWDRLPWRIDAGRMNVLTEVERRATGLGITELSVGTSTPIPVYLGLVKLALLGGGIATVVAFVRSLRWRAAGGTLVRASRRTLVLVTVGGVLTVAIGVQAQVQERNGWTAYPVSTYGAVISIFGTIALLLWLTRLVASGSRRITIAAVGVLVLLGVSTNFRYELVFPAVPVAAIALAIIPVTARADRAAGRRAKLITGAAYFGSFIPLFIAIRLYLAHVCSQGNCYTGVQTELSPRAVRATVYGLISSVPGSGRDELLADLKRVGWASRYPVLPTWWSVLIGIAAIAAMLILWWALQHDQSAPADLGRAVERPGDQRRAEAILLAVGAGLSLLVAVGAAAVIGLANRSQDILAAPGTPYRNAVVTWVGLAFCLVLVVVAVGILSSRRGALLTWGALAAVVGIVAAVFLPPNLMALRASRVTHEFTEAINWEFVQGDPTPAGEARRCELYAAIDGKTVGYAEKAFLNYTNSAFEAVHGRPFCSALAAQPQQ
ncbi:MAG: hypothetical protein ACRDWG_11510 [Actinomycetes bacterium]